MGKEFVEKKTEFNMNGKRIKIGIVLRTIDDFNINNALINWSARTEKFTSESFRDYIKYKEPYLDIWTIKEFKNLNNTK